VEIDWKHYVLPGIAAAAYLGWLVLRPAEVSDPAPASQEAPSTDDATRSAEGGNGSPQATSQQRADRDAMRERIVEALAPRAGPGAGKPVVPTGSTAQIAELDPVWVRERIVEDVAPAAKRCYLARLEKDPSLQARIDIALTFLGHENVGTVVDDAEIVAASLDDADFVECVRESILALVIEPPRGAGKRTVSHSLVFAPPDATGG
jgi:hypothetical protein